MRDGGRRSDLHLLGAPTVLTHIYKGMNQDTSDGKGGAHEREPHYSSESEARNKSREQSEERVPSDKCSRSPRDLFRAFLPPASVKGLNAAPVMASSLHII